LIATVNYHFNDWISKKRNHKYRNPQKE